MDLGLAQVDDPADLREIVVGVGLDLLLGQLGAGLVAARGVADQGRVVADDDDGRVTQVLELAQLAQGDRVPEVDVDAGRVDAVLDAQRAVLADRAFELLEELGLGDDLLDPAFQDRKLFGDIPHRAIRLHGDDGSEDSTSSPGRRCTEAQGFADSRDRAPGSTRWPIAREASTIYGDHPDSPRAVSRN